MTKYIKNYAIFTAGLYLLSLGIVLIVRSMLGTTPISCANYVLSLNTPLSLGTWTTITNCLMIVLQFALLQKGRADLRKRRVEILLQLPFSVLFSAFIDLNMLLTASLAPSVYLCSLAMLVGGCVVQATGVVLELKGHVVMMSAEGLVARIADRTGKVFGNVKIVFDTTLVLIALALSLLLSGTVEGIREGTVIAAVITGPIIKFLTSRIMTAATLGKIRKKMHIKWYI